MLHNSTDRKLPGQPLSTDQNRLSTAEAALALAFFVSPELAALGRSSVLDTLSEKLEKCSYNGLKLSDIFLSGIYHKTIYSNSFGWGPELAENFPSVKDEFNDQFSRRKICSSGWFSGPRNWWLENTIYSELEAKYRKPIQEATKGLEKLNLITEHTARDNWRGARIYWFTNTELGVDLLKLIGKKNS